MPDPGIQAIFNALPVLIGGAATAGLATSAAVSRLTLGAASDAHDQVLGPFEDVGPREKIEPPIFAVLGFPDRPGIVTTSVRNPLAVRLISDDYVTPRDIIGLRPAFDEMGRSQDPGIIQQGDLEVQTTFAVKLAGPEFFSRLLGKGATYVYFFDVAPRTDMKSDTPHFRVRRARVDHAALNTLQRLLLEDGRVGGGLAVALGLVLAVLWETASSRMGLADMNLCRPLLAGGLAGLGSYRVSLDSSMTPDGFSGAVGGGLLGYLAGGFLHLAATTLFP